jgi:tetratricopeptide (TPR) repeat protein
MSIPEKQKENDSGVVVTELTRKKPITHSPKFRQNAPRLFIAVVGVLFIIFFVWLWHSHDKSHARSVSDSKLALATVESNGPNATKALNQYLTEGPTIAQKQFALVEVGNVYSSSGQNQKAISYYLQAQALAPDKNQLYIDQALATSYDSLGQSTQAIIYYRKAVEALPPNDPETPGTKIGYEQRIAELSQ